MARAFSMKRAEPQLTECSLKLTLKGSLFFIWNFYLYTRQSLGNDHPVPFVAAMPGRSKIKK